ERRVARRRPRADGLLRDGGHVPDQCARLKLTAAGRAVTVEHRVADESTSGRILVVDDDDIIRETVAEALQLDGFDVDTARNGAEALDVVRQRPPSGIVLDLMMPIMTGWQFLERCRASQLCSGIPIVVMSAYSKL